MAEFDAGGGGPPLEPPTATKAVSSTALNRRIVLTDQISLLLAQVIHANLKRWYWVLKDKVHGKGRFILELVNFLNNSDHEAIRGKTTTEQTVRIWIATGKQSASNEHSRREEIRMRGRGAEDLSSVEPHITAWYDLMQEFHELSKHDEEVSKNGRYAVLQHLAHLGIKLQKSDTSFLPRHNT